MQIDVEVVESQREGHDVDDFDEDGGGLQQHEEEEPPTRNILLHHIYWLKSNR